MGDPAEPNHVEEIMARLLELPADERLDRLGELVENERLRSQIAALLDESQLANEDTLNFPIGMIPENTSIPELNAEPERAAPAKIGHYSLIRKLGEGGMGTVYEAVQENPRRHVALKVIASRVRSEATRKRFQFETEILGRLKHSGIAQIYEAHLGDSDEETPFFAMELVEGEALSQYCDAQQLTARRRLEITARLCDAIHHAHQKGVVHRDLKPSNILVTSDGLPKVLDFGVARALESDSDVTLQTKTGHVIGTVAYMSPEQASAGAMDIDARSDIYSVGVILYELLSGRSPYDLKGKSLVASLEMIRKDPPGRLGTLDTALRGDVETIVGKALEKDRDRRYASAAELAQDIRRYLNDEPILAHPPSTLYQIRKFTKRNRLLVVGSCLAVILLVATSGVSTWLWRSADAAAIRERTERLRAQESERRADREAKKANELVQALRDMLASANPEASGVPDVTIRQMLDRYTDRQLPALENQPDVAATLRGTIADVYAGLGDYDEAVKQAEMAYELAERELGPDDITTLKVLSTCGIAYRGQRRLDLAIRTQKKALAGLRRQLGPDHRDTIFVVVRLANLYSDQGRLLEAESMLREVIPISERINGPTSRRTLTAQLSLGAILYQSARLAEAEPVFRKLVEQHREIDGDDHPITLRNINNLAVVLIELGRDADAIPLLEECLESRRYMLPEGHPSTLKAIIDLGRIHYDRGEYEDALPRLLEFHDTPGTHANESYEYFQNVRLILGHTLLEAKQYARAEELLEGTYRFYVRQEGPDGESTKMGRSLLMRLYGETDQREKAMALRPLAPDTPVIQPESGEQRLIASDFAHPVDSVKHFMSEWQLREIDADYNTTPTLSCVSQRELTMLTIPKGLLQPDTQYEWRVRYVGSNNITSEFSTPVSFRTKPSPLMAISIPITEHLNRDVVRNAGDEENDSFDADANGQLMVEGFDGSYDKNKNIHGLPIDQKIGVYQLASYDDANAMQLTQSDDQIVTIEVVPTKIEAIRFLVASGNGNSQIPVTLEFDDGSTVDRPLPSLDWFSEFVPFRPDVLVTPCWDGMDRFNDDALDDANAAALFDVHIPVENDAKLVRIRLKPVPAGFNSERTRFNLFAVTVMSRTD